MSNRTLEQRETAYNKVKSFIFDSEYMQNDEQKSNALRSLFNYLETETPWLTAFCSTAYHNSYEGGLLDHSINVANTALRLARVLAPDLNEVEIVITALLHDCGKCDMYKRKPATERQKQYGYPGSMGVDTDTPYMEHEDKSLWIITKFYPYLTEEMFCAIAQHNEPWLTSTSQFRHNKLMTLIQNADYWCCMYVDEPGSASK